MSEYLIEGLLSTTALIVLLAIPASFIYLKNGKNKLIFILTNLGAVWLVTSVSSLLVMPFFYINHEIFPALYAESGAPDYILPLINTVEMIADLEIVIPVILMILSSAISPFIIYCRTSMFVSEENA